VVGDMAYLETPMVHCEFRKAKQGVPESSATPSVTRQNVRGRTAGYFLRLSGTLKGSWTVDGSVDRNPGLAVHAN
jgi:hypothetical protein